MPVGSVYLIKNAAKALQHASAAPFCAKARIDVYAGLFFLLKIDIIRLWYQALE